VDLDANGIRNARLIAQPERHVFRQKSPQPIYTIATFRGGYEKWLFYAT
jgi:hypothetical protein